MDALLLSLFAGLKRLGAFLERVQTLILGVLGYYGAITPAGLFLRALGTDPLGRPKPGAGTYWRPRSPRKPGAFTQQG